MIAPLSTTYTTHRRPTLRWELPAGAAGARVQVCRDRGCTQVEAELRATERSARPVEELAPGVHFWRVFGTDANGADVTPPSFVWEFFAPHRSTPRDDTRGTFLDVNGDGYADIVATVEQRFSVGQVRMGISVYFGRREGPREEPGQVLLEEDLQAAYPCPHFVGDVNGDGYGDLLWGCSLAVPDSTGPTTVRGVAELFLGSPAGLVRLSPRRLLRGGERAAWFGDYASPMGDVDMDGYGDFAVGTSRYSNLFDSRPHVLLGGPDGSQGMRRLMLERPPASTSRWGHFLESNVGDINGDGHPDLFVGEGSLLVTPLNRNNYIYFGQPGGAAPRYAATIERPPLLSDQPRSWHNRRGPCDLNGDGLADLVFEAFEGERYGVAVHLGRSQVPVMWSRDRFVRPPSAQSPSRYNVSCAGDLNGDGYSDLLVRVTTERPPTMWFLRGAPDTSETWWSVTLDNISTVFGSAVGGDVNGDALADVVSSVGLGNAGEPDLRMVALADRARGLTVHGLLMPPLNMRFSGNFTF